MFAQLLRRKQLGLSLPARPKPTERRQIRNHDPTRPFREDRLQPVLPGQYRQIQVHCRARPGRDRGAATPNRLSSPEAHVANL